MPEFEQDVIGPADEHYEPGLCPECGKRAVVMHETTVISWLWDEDDQAWHIHGQEGNGIDEAGCGNGHTWPVTLVDDDA